MHKNKYLLETTGCGAAFYDFDDDGWLDIFLVNGWRLEGFPAGEEPVCYLFKNNRDGTFTDITRKAGLARSGWGQGVCIGDYDNDGFEDLFLTYYGKNALYHNNGDGTFTDVSEKSGIAGKKTRWSTGCAFMDYDRDGNLDIFKTNFAGDTHSLYRNRGDGNFEDRTFESGLGLNTRYLGWGCGFFDMDNDGWPDILVCNGHVYPEVEQLTTEAGYAQRKLLYRNRNGRFEDVSLKGGPAIQAPSAARGCAFGDFDNDGDLDVLVSTINGPPELIRCDVRNHNNWLKVRTIGVRSNRSGIGARLSCTIKAEDGKSELRLIDEVRSGGSYLSQSDLRVHFGLGKAEKVELLEIKWPSGQIDRISKVAANRLIYVKEGQGIVKTMEFGAKRKS